MVIFQFLIDPWQIMLKFAVLEFVLFHVVVEHFQTISNIVVGEALEAFGNLDEVYVVTHFKNNLNFI